MLTLRIEPPWRVSPERAGSAEEFARQHAADRLAAAAFYQGILGRIRSVPGVVQAAAVNRRSLSGNWWSTDFRLENGAEPQPDPRAPDVPCRRQLSFGISAVDLPTYAGAAILVVFVSLASSVFPLVQALAIDPIEVLRS